MNADERRFITPEHVQIKAPPAPSCGAFGLSITGERDRFKEAGFEGASRKNTFTPLSKDI
jgi:hypothetical protein